MESFCGVQDDILMFGGSGGRESRPQYVQNEWSLAAEFLKDFTGVVCPSPKVILVSRTVYIIAGSRGLIVPVLMKSQV